MIETLTARAALRKGKAGLPADVKASISPEGRVSIRGWRSGELVLECSASEASKAGKGSGYFAFAVRDGYYSLEFIEVWKKMIAVTVLGIVPYLIFLSKADRIAKAWKEAFSAAGVDVGTLNF